MREILDCKFLNCVINNNGKCCSTNELKCKEVPSCFKED